MDQFISELLKKRGESPIEMELSPFEAEILLRHTKGESRPISIRRIAKFEERMLSGDWDKRKEDESPIAIDYQTGDIIDGQHRLLALIKAGCRKKDSSKFKIKVSIEFVKQD